MSGKILVAIPTAQDWLLQIKPQRWMYGQRLNEETPTKEVPHERPKRSRTERSYPCIWAAACDAGARSSQVPAETGQRIGGGLGSTV